MYSEDARAARTAAVPRGALVDVGAGGGRYADGRSPRTEANDARVNDRVPCAAHVRGRRKGRTAEEGRATPGSARSRLGSAVPYR